MGKKLYVGNLPYTLTQEQVQEMFEQVGTVVQVTLVTDRETGRPKGFGFVEMETEEDAREAIKRFDGKSVNNRSLTVNEARPREERGPRGDGGGYNRGGDGGGYGRSEGRGGRDGGYGGGGGGGDDDRRRNSNDRRNRY